MNIRTQLLKEHSKNNSKIIAEYIGENKQKVEELVELFLSNEYRVSQRSSMVFSLISDKYPDSLTPYIGRLVGVLCNKETVESVLRVTVRFFQFYKIPEELEGIVLERCYELLKDIEKGVAIRSFSIAVIYNISEPYSELKKELKLVLEDLFVEDSPGLKSRRNAYLKRLEAF